MKAVLALVLVVFAVALAYFVGTAVDPAALQVVLGVVVGAIAMLPISILLVVAMGRAQRVRDEAALGQMEMGRHAAQPGTYPPVVVIQGGTAIPQQTPFMPAMEMRPERGMRIIGED